MGIRTKIIQPGAEHERLRLALCAVVRRKAPDMPAEEILAIFCQIVGQLVALQDQRRFTSESIMTLVSANIEMGNQQAVDTLLNAPGGGRPSIPSSDAGRAKRRRVLHVVGQGGP